MQLIQDPGCTLDLVPHSFAHVLDLAIVSAFNSPCPGPPPQVLSHSDSEQGEVCSRNEVFKMLRIFHGRLQTMFPGPQLADATTRKSRPRKNYFDVPKTVATRSQVSKNNTIFNE